MVMVDEDEFNDITNGHLPNFGAGKTQNKADSTATCDDIVGAGSGAHVVNLTYGDIVWSGAETTSSTYMCGQI